MDPNLSWIKNAVVCSTEQENVPRDDDTVGSSSAAENHELGILAPNLQQGGRVRSQLRRGDPLHRDFGPARCEGVELPELPEQRLGGQPLLVVLKVRVFLEVGIVTPERVNGALVIDDPVTAALTRTEDFA